MNTAPTQQIARQLIAYYRLKKFPPLSQLSGYVTTLKRIFAHRHPATVGDKALLKLVKRSAERGGPSKLFRSDLTELMTEIAVAFRFDVKSPDKTEV